MALSVLFIELFPGWLAALLGIGILAAVMSTADGLVVSSSQIESVGTWSSVSLPSSQLSTVHETPSSGSGAVPA